MGTSELFWTVAGMTLVTLAPRVLPIWFLSGRGLPEGVKRWLALIAPAILAALLVPELLLSQGEGGASLFLSPQNHALLAAIPAGIVAWRTRSLFGTVAAGIVCAALLRALM